METSFIEEVGRQSLGTYVALLGLYATVMLTFARFRHQRELASKRATLDFIATNEVHNYEWTKICAASHAALSDEKRWSSILKPQDDSSRELAMNVFAYLNHFELVAISIREEIINKRLYAKWYKTSYVRKWRTAKPFVEKARLDRDSRAIMIEFEKLADDWAEEYDIK